MEKCKAKQSKTKEKTEKIEKKAAIKAEAEENRAIQNIKDKLIKTQNLVPYNGIFTCCICMNDFEENVYIFECSECKNKACLTCIAKSIDHYDYYDHYDSRLQCYFCRKDIPFELGLINWQRNLKRNLKQYAGLCFLVTNCASIAFILLC